MIALKKDFSVANAIEDSLTLTLDAVGIATTKSGTTVIAYIFLVYIILNLKRIFLYILEWYKRNQPMVYDWYDKGRIRINYCCPLVKNKIKQCPFKEECSPSAYGRVIYVKPSNDLRLFTAIPRNTYLWKQIMKKRTSSQRVNKRILEDYNIEEAHCRGKKRWSWWTLIHSINIHLDAQISILKTNILDILESAISKAS